MVSTENLIPVLLGISGGIALPRILDVSLAILMIWVIAASLMVDSIEKYWNQREKSDERMEGI